MKLKIQLFFYALFSIVIFGQNNCNTKTEEIIIESGKTFKIYKDAKLDSIIVSMAAVNYGNALVFSKSKDQIRIINAEDKQSVISIELKNKKQVKTFFYKNKPIITIENLDFDLNNLPKNTIIARNISENIINTFTTKTNYENLGEDNPDKTFKLFSRLMIKSDLDNIDDIFINIADFFSKEDALLKIYYGQYAEKFEPKTLAFLKTDELGKIKTGILWNGNATSLNNKEQYDLYDNGKIIKSGSQTLDEFQKTFLDFIKDFYK